MERRRSSGTIAKSMYYSQKRILAFLLTAAMVFTNLGTGLNVSYAGTADQVTFQMKGADLVAAVEEAIESGHEITADDLGFTNGRTAEFEKVFFGTKGAVYEVYPEMEGSSMEAELRVFVRLPEDAGDMYMVTGDEEIILLYVNNGEDTISCTTEITRMDDGVEKVKKTKRVTIRSYEDAFGDEEVDIISKPVQEETEASESETSAESGADGTGSQLCRRKAWMSAEAVKTVETAETAAKIPSEAAKTAVKTAAKTRRRHHGLRTGPLVRPAMQTTVRLIQKPRRRTMLREQIQRKTMLPIQRQRYRKRTADLVLMRSRKRILRTRIRTPRSRRTGKKSQIRMRIRRKRELCRQLPFPVMMPRLYLRKRRAVRQIPQM